MRISGVRALVLAGLAIAAMVAAALPAFADPLSLTVAKAAVIIDASGQRGLSVTLTPQSQKDLATFTAANVGRFIDVSVDGKVLLSPRILDPITSGVVLVTGKFAPGEFETLARELSSGQTVMTIDLKRE